MAPTLYVFGFEVPSYGIMIALGCAAGLAVVLRRHVRTGFSRRALTAAFAWAGLGSFVGGKTFFVLQGLPLFLRWSGASFASFLGYIASAGLVFYGGMIGCLCFIGLYALLFHQPGWKLLDALIPALPLTQAFGRVGCLLAGCCYGIPSSFGFWMSPAGPAPTEEPLFPVQLAEAAAVFAIFLWMERYGRTTRPPGAMLGRYLTGYGTVRFLLEFLRGDSVRGSWGALSVSQWISVAVVIAGALLLRWSERRGDILQAPRPGRKQAEVREGEV